MEIWEYLRECVGKEEDFEELIQEIYPEMEVRAFLKRGLEEARMGSFKEERRARTRLLLIACAWQYDVNAGTGIQENRNAHSSASILQTLRTCFFSQGWALELYDILRREGLTDADFHRRMFKMAQDILQTGERDCNNRAFFYALGHAYAARSFPEAKQAVTWLEYANAVFDDWHESGDCFEPGYVAHNISWVIQLGTVLGRERELTDKRALSIYERYLNHISPGGLAVAPGDGDDQSAYLPGLRLMYEVTKDKRYLWAIESVTAAGEYGGYRCKKGGRLQQPEQVIHNGVEPEGCTQVQHLYPDTLKIPDRILLNPSRHPGNPYLGMLINDRYDTLHHASEDNRGEIYHYEVGGQLYLKRSGWYKWAEQTNTLIMRDSTEEYPFTYGQGLQKGHWYHGSGDLRLLQHFFPDAEYEMCLESFERFQHFARAIEVSHSYDMPLPLQYTKKSSPLGLFLSNPGGMAGRNTRVQITDITLSIHTFSEKYWEGEDSFAAVMAWNRDGDRRPAFSKSEIDMVIRGIRLTGPAGKRYLEDICNLEDCLQVIHYPVGGGQHLLDAQEKSSLIQIVKNGQTEFHVHCPFGRLDLFFTGMKEQIDLQEEYRRLDFDYCYLSDVRNYLRTPIKILVNRITTRSLYVDHQQGGILKNCGTRQQGKDCYGEVLYEGIYTCDTKWQRKCLLTEEGYLVAVDELIPGEDAEGMAGGPVWQLGRISEMGLQWADSGDFLVYCHPQRGHCCGVQCQPKIQIDKEYAFYDRAILEAGRCEMFVTVMIPHDRSVNPVELCQKRNRCGRLEPEKVSQEECEGILTQIDAHGNIAIVLNNRHLSNRIEICIEKNGEWKVKRQAVSFRAEVPSVEM